MDCCLFRTGTELFECEWSRQRNQYEVAQADVYWIIEMTGSKTIEANRATIRATVLVSY